jgi:DNA-binding MarR family transcriptional regulator
VNAGAPPVDPPRVAFDDALVAFFRAARRARGRAARRTDRDGLSLAQFYVLEPLVEGPQPMSRVADDAGIAPPTATRTLDGLVERGYAERSTDPGDRRAVYASLTPAGRAAVAAKAEEFEELRGQIADVFDEEEQERAADLLRRLADVIEEL